MSAPALSVRPYQPSDAEAWDALVGRSANGTFLHTRRFLSYHRGRFEDRSLVACDRRGRPRAVLPAAVEPADPAAVASHPGATYGGLVHDAGLYGEGVLEVLEAMCGLLRASGAKALRYRATPSIYHRLPAQDDLHALARLGARSERRDLAAVIDLAARPRPWKRRRQRRRAAEGAAVELRWGWEALPDYWPLQQAVLAERFGVAPAHTAQEIGELARRFPERVHLLTARLGGEVAAGGVLFENPPVAHLQYSASSPAGRRANALDALVESAVAWAQARSLRWFSFGISTTEEGTRLNQSLYEFKRSFGAGGLVHEHLRLEL